jgi:hypothetical protein
MCHCVWRMLFNCNGIYPLAESVDGPLKLFEALRKWVQSPESLRQLQVWNSNEIELLIDVMEQVSLKSLSKSLNIAIYLTGHSCSKCGRTSLRVFRSDTILSQLDKEDFKKNWYPPEVTHLT